MPLPVPDLTPLADFSEEDLKEMVMGELSPRVDNIAYDKADVTMTYKVPYTKLTGFLCWMLGVDYVDSNSKLRRTCPAFHPVYPWLWCDTVQIQGMAFRGDDTDIVQYEWQNTPAKWDSLIAVCSYSMPDYNVYYDDEVSNEYSRFLSKEYQPNTQLVSIDPGMVVYDTNNTKSWEAKPSLQLVTRKETAGIKLTWHRVPLAFLCADDDSLPTKLLQMQGRVNDATFLGQPAETLLCQHVHIRKYVSPLITNLVGQLYFICDIEFDLAWYDPLPKGYTAAVANGWNYMIAPDLQYYYCKNASSNRPVFQSFTFAKAFTHYSDTWTPP